MKTLILEDLPLEEGVEKNRIIPKHAGGSNEINNIVLVSTKNHTLVHYYRFLAYQEKGDWVAYVMGKDQKTNIRVFGSLLAVVKNKDLSI